jgi:hypothetical protein
MSDYYAWFHTNDDGIKLKSRRAFEADLETLKHMFEGYVGDQWYLSYDREGRDMNAILWISGDDGASLDISVDAMEAYEWYNRLPPGSWTDDQKKAHAHTVGYLPDWAAIVDTGDDSVNLLPLIRRHMVDGCVAVIHGVAYGDGTTWYWSVAFTSEKEEWDSQHDVEKRLIEKMKIAK